MHPSRGIYLTTNYIARSHQHSLESTRRRVGDTHCRTSVFGTVPNSGLFATNAHKVRISQHNFKCKHPEAMRAPKDCGTFEEISFGRLNHADVVRFY